MSNSILWSIFNEGWNVGLDGLICECPYPDWEPAKRSAWLSGREYGALEYRRRMDAEEALEATAASDPCAGCDRAQYGACAEVCG